MINDTILLIKKMCNTITIWTLSYINHHSKLHFIQYVTQDNGISDKYNIIFNLTTHHGITRVSLMWLSVNVIASPRWGIINKQFVYADIYIQHGQCQQVTPDIVGQRSPTFRTQPSKGASKCITIIIFYTKKIVYCRNLSEKCNDDKERSVHPLQRRIQLT